MKKRLLALLVVPILMSLFVVGVGAESTTAKPELEYGEVLWSNDLTELPAGTAWGTTTTGWSADGECVTLSGEQDNWYVLDGTDSFDDDCIISIDLTLHSDYGAVGLGFRKWDGDPNQSGYEIDWLTGSGTLSMHRPWSGYDTQNAEVMPENGVTHNLTVVLSGYNVDFYVDGEFINTLYADLYPSDGSLALYGYHCTATFQNIVVYALPEEETSATTEPVTTEPKQTTEEESKPDSEKASTDETEDASASSDTANVSDTGAVTDGEASGGLSTPVIIVLVAAVVLVLAVIVVIVMKNKKK